LAYHETIRDGPKGGLSAPHSFILSSLELHSQLLSASISLCQLMSTYLSFYQLIYLYQLLGILVSHSQTLRCIITTFNNSNEGSCCHITLGKRDTRKSRKGVCKSTFITCFRTANATNLISTYSILNPLQSLLALEDLGGLCTIRLTKAQSDYNNSWISQN